MELSEKVSGLSRQWNQRCQRLAKEEAHGVHFSSDTPPEPDMPGVVWQGCGAKLPASCSCWGRANWFGVSVLSIIRKFQCSRPLCSDLQAVEDEDDEVVADTEGSLEEDVGYNS